MNCVLENSPTALFLDFDGTLVDLAETPDAVTVPRQLPAALARAHAALGGALCIVSGRPLADLRRYLPETPVDIVAEHGAVLARTGEIAILAPAWPHAWRDAIRDSEQRFTGLFVERKHASIALHYRARPEIEGELLALAERMRRTVRGDFTVTCSSFTIEIRPQHIDKGRAIQALMTTAPYAGRRPVFVADDETDRPGFKVVSALDGLALWVDEAFGGSTAKVRAWLAEIAGLEGIY